jgi:hypothetical protein
MRYERHESTGGSVFGGYGFCNYTPAASSRPAHVHDDLVAAGPAPQAGWMTALLQHASEIVARLARS